MIARAGSLRREGPGGTLVKISKPGQERRVDMPVIGAETVRLAAEAGLRGIAVEAGGTLILDRPAVTAAADASGLFVVGGRPRRPLAHRAADRSTSSSWHASRRATPWPPA